MRLKVIAILALLALVGAAGLGGSRALASVNGPAQGDPASVINFDGDELATITVTDIQDPFEEYSEFSEPEEGTRFVMAQIEVENTGERPFEFSEFDVYVRDTLGRTYGSTFISPEEGFEEENPPLEGSNMGSGDTISGALYFVVFEDADLSDVLYQSTGNDTSVLISIADLNESEAARPAGAMTKMPTPATRTPRPDDEDAAADDDSSSADDEDSSDNTGTDGGSDDPLTRMSRPMTTPSRPRRANLRALMTGQLSADQPANVSARYREEEGGLTWAALVLLCAVGCVVPCFARILPGLGGDEIAAWRRSTIGRGRPRREERMRRVMLVIAVMMAIIGLAGNGRVVAQEGGFGTNPIGEPVPIYNVDGDEVAEVTVEEVIDPFEDYEEFGEPAEDERFVLAEITVENSGDRPFEFNLYNFYVVDSLGRATSSAFVSRTEESIEEYPDLESTNMNQGESVTGAILYRVAADAELTQLYYSFYGDIQMFYALADLSGGTGGSSRRR